MKKEYDHIIAQHYDKEAKKKGFSACSTMADEITRKLETEAIINFVKECLARRTAGGISGPAIILDVGCGNGYTLETLLNKYPEQKYIGIEKSPKLRQLAKTRLSFHRNVDIRAGDIRDNDFIEPNSVDILICQRVIINLLAEEDQYLALDNIIRAVVYANAQCEGGKLLFIEGFKSSLANLNKARNEFDLPSINPAYHNLYLPDNFFSRPDIRAFDRDGSLSAPNFLSTHYFVSRVLHPIFTSGKPLERNSEFVKFFSQALHQFVGDYSPLKLYMFEKVR
jgi:SAM-dependent methyltransferase